VRRDSRRTNALGTDDVSTDDSLAEVRIPIPLGTVVVTLPPRALLPADFAPAAFGRTGFILVFDARTKHVLYDGRSPDAGRDLDDAELLPAGGSGAPSLPVQYGHGDSVRVASVVHIDVPPLAIMSSTAVAEFGAGLPSARARDFALFLAIAGAAALAFIALLGRTTRSLEQLTRAATVVGDGDLAPSLPTEHDDEVGALTRAFRQMIDRVGATMREIEVSRQMAVLGEFSAQLAHEVRNPLTGIKLNLQILDRRARLEKWNDDERMPLQTCLHEIRRLDGVVRTALSVARPRSAERRSTSVHASLNHVLGLLAEEIDGRGIELSRSYRAAADLVLGDAAQLTGTFVNLMTNAIEAQPSGGRIFVGTRATTIANHPAIEVTIADDGPGIPESAKSQLFQPFKTTKMNGTGLGLAMAMTTARQHEGHIRTIEPPVGMVGAAFIVTLPLHRADDQP
jgi:signal transduction histidine kinase